MKLEKKALGISLYLFIASFFSERLWFNSDHLNLHNSIYIITKVMLLFALIILGQVLYKGIIRVLQKDENAVFFAKVFFVYFILLITVLLLIWPGIWRWDEFWMIDGSKWFYVAAAQNFLMSFFYICCLSILPFPAGIIIIQLLCVSGMVAYFVVNIYKWIIKDKKIASLTLIPFLLFPVIDSNLYPLRCTLYAFVELTLLSMILFKVIEFQKEQEKKVSNIFIFVYIIFSIILSVMRTEGKYYIILAPVLYIWFLGKYSNSRQKLAVVCVVLICSLAGNNYQNKIMQEQIGDRNTIVSTLNYLQYILKDDNLKNYIIDMLNYSTMSTSNELKLQGLLYLFFSELASISTKPYKAKNSFENIYITKSIEFIEKNYDNAYIKVSDISNYLCLNRTYLTSLFNKHLNTSPQKFLMEFRIRKAEELLYQTDLPIGDIARSCGYSDPLAFSRSFKKFKGVNPTLYREEKRKFSNKLTQLPDK